MKYTLNTYGWGGEFIGKTLTKEQTKQIDILKEDRKVDNLNEIRFELEDEMNFDIWDGDLLHINGSFDNSTLNFEIIDENGEIVVTFNVDEIKSFDVNKVPVKSYNMSPTENHNVFFSIDEYKGGIYSYDFESDTLPTIGDFNYTQTFIDTPDGFWDIIDNIIYKNNVLEIYDHLDSTGKSSDVFIFKSDNYCHYSDLPSVNAYIKPVNIAKTPEPVVVNNPNLCKCHPENGGNGTCQCD